MQKKLYYADAIVAKFPFTLPHNPTMRVLRYDPPSRAWPSGKVVLNNGHENLLASPPTVQLCVR